MPKNKIILATFPNHDMTVRYISAWGRKVLDEASRQGVKILILKDKRANKLELEKMIKKHNPALVFLNGHGNENAIGGQDDSVLVSLADKNQHILKDSITYAVSCSSAKNLGVGVIESGGSAYIGYQEDFVFFCNQSKMAHPLEDEVAKLFLEPSNQVTISLLKGNTAQTSSNNSKKFFWRNAKKLLGSEASPESGQYIKILLWNMKNQVCLGDGSSKF